MRLRLFPEVIQSSNSDEDLLKETMEKEIPFGATSPEEVWRRQRVMSNYEVRSFILEINYTEVGISKVV